MTYRRDDQTEIEVEHVIEQRGYPSNGWDDAGESTVVSITEAFDMAGNPVELTDAERERIELEIADELESEPYDEDFGE